GASAPIIVFCSAPCAGGGAPYCGLGAPYAGGGAPYAGGGAPAAGGAPAPPSLGASCAIIVFCSPSPPSLGASCAIIVFCSASPLGGAYPGVVPSGGSLGASC